MKKIIGIILAVLMMFGMSTMAFADYVVAPEAPTKNVTVNVTLTQCDKAPVVFEQDIVEGKVVREIKGRAATFKIGIVNGTDKAVAWETVLDGLNIVAESYPKGEKTYDYYGTPAWGGEGRGDSLANVINPGKMWGHDYDVKVLTTDSLQFEVIFGETIKVIDTVGETATFKLVAAPVVETTTQVTTTTTTTQAPTETTTEATTTTTIAPTYVEDTEETGGDDYVEAPVEDDIPNTGSTPVIGAVAALGLAAGAIILLKKKNK